MPYLRRPPHSICTFGTVTNGSIRDIAAVAEGFQMLAGSIAPSHAYVRVVDFGVSVTIHSMEVQSGDLIHADRHGAVVVPMESIDAMAAALDGLMKREAKIIAAARAPGATAESIKTAMKGQASNERQAGCSKRSFRPERSYRDYGIPFRLLHRRALADHDR